ncbi:hypothetical protein ALC57_14668 [Trachymyrmex cornetzi]|uniref:Uncharacterized protein n=1 Tax=Trachymyrmex cornetzi TaxID=471704 RepID=A0A151IXX3_9HYME|nr:hypothetical protein ALC57_14668 [Trachymyrmex cornetzi]
MDPWGVSLPLTRPEANWPESRVAFPSSGSGSDTEGVRSFKKNEKGEVYDEWTDGTPPPPPPPPSSREGRWRKGKKKCSVQTRQRLSSTEAVTQIGGNAKRLPWSGNARQRNRKKEETTHGGVLAQVGATAAAQPDSTPVSRSTDANCPAPQRSLRTWAAADDTR